MMAGSFDGVSYGGFDSGCGCGGMAPEMGMPQGMMGLPMTYGGDGGFPVSGGMEPGPQTFVPYSFEASPTPHPMGGGQGGPVPPQQRPQQDPIPEGQFEQAPNDAGDVIRGRQTSAPLQQTRWVPSGF